MYVDQAFQPLLQLAGLGFFPFLKVQDPLHGVATGGPKLWAHPRLEAFVLFTYSCTQSSYELRAAGACRRAIAQMRAVAAAVSTRQRAKD